MKILRIDGKTIIMYDDGSIRISFNGEHLCLDRIDIEVMYNESRRILTSSVEWRKKTDGVYLNRSLG